MVWLAIGAARYEEGAIGRLQRPCRQRIAVHASPPFKSDKTDQTCLWPVPGQAGMRVDKGGQLVEIGKAAAADPRQQFGPAAGLKGDFGNRLSKMVADLRAVFTKHQRIMDHLLVAADHPSKTQTLHAKYFRDTSRGYAARIHAGNRGHPLPRPFKSGIDLVNNQPAVISTGDMGKTGQLIAIHKPARRIVGIGQEDHPRAR